MTGQLALSDFLLPLDQMNLIHLTIQGGLSVLKNLSTLRFSDSVKKILNTKYHVPTVMYRES